jgi:5-methylcytosine-specific restriction protein A
VLLRADHGYTSLPSVPQARLRGRAWQAIRRAVLADTPLCVHCIKAGRVRVAREVDHIVPLYRGGTHEWSNLQALCFACHKAKSLSERTTKRRVGLDGWPR